MLMELKSLKIFSYSQLLDKERRDWDLFSYPSLLLTDAFGYLFMHPKPA